MFDITRGVMSSDPHLSDLLDGVRSAASVRSTGILYRQ